MAVPGADEVVVVVAAAVAASALAGVLPWSLLASLLLGAQLHLSFLRKIVHQIPYQVLNNSKILCIFIVSY